ncbi:MAG: type II/IV secretion system protein [Deltaproteobacteria bacterium]|nr:type II/IV secretion system protein [Deltaproteobacteria bacterium]
MDKKEALLEVLINANLLGDQPRKDIWRSPDIGLLLALHKAKILDEEKAFTFLSEKFQVPFYRKKDAELLEKLKNYKLVEKISADALWSFKVFPLWEEEDKVVFAFMNPLDLDAQNHFQFLLSKQIGIALMPEADIESLLVEYFPKREIKYDDQDEAHEQYVEILGEVESEKPIDLSDTLAPPIVRLANKILVDAVKARASDIHIEPMYDALDVRYRVDGKMSHVVAVPKRLQPYLTSRFKILSGMDIAEKRKTQDGGFRIRVQNEIIDIRASAVPTTSGETLVLRLLKSDKELISLENLGMSETIRNGILKALDSDGKMLLVTGPTGSGKTTTLYACLRHLNDGTTNIITVEDPIEYQIDDINQIQVNPAKDVTFPSALRSVLRQDPDVIMVGEIRDEETAEISIQAAETGHKVLSTLHTNSAISTISRLEHLGVSLHLMGSTLGGILAQRLVRKMCPECLVEFKPESEEIDAEVRQLGLDPADLKVGAGCSDCKNTGYFGRIGVYSYLEISDAVSNLLLEAGDLGLIRQTAKSEGFVSLRDAALELLVNGETSYEEVRPYLIQPKPDRQLKEVRLDSEEIDLHKKSGKIEKPKILLIEDDDDVRFSLSELLKRDMFEVIEASNGLEGLERFYEDPPDIVLCDLMMPKVDGKEFLKKLRGNRDTHDTPVIILTAADTAVNEVSLLELGARDFVSKTTPAEVMLTRIRRLLQD